MTIEAKKYVERGVEVWEQVCPEGWTIVDNYSPDGLTPWDVYGLGHQQEYMKVLMVANIDCMALIERHRNIGARGTGPGGRVRFGDDMMPGRYKIAVKNEDVPLVQPVFDAHKEAIRVWLDKKGPMPLACRR